MGTYSLKAGKIRYTPATKPSPAPKVAASKEEAKLPLWIAHINGQRYKHRAHTKGEVRAFLKRETGQALPPGLVIVKR